MCVNAAGILKLKLDVFPVLSDDSEDGDFFYDEAEVLSGAGAENRAALLDHYDAMLDISDQPEQDEVFG